MGERFETMLSAVDRETLVCLLVCGANSPGNIAVIVDRHHQSIQRRLTELIEMGFVRKKGDAGVYDLTDKGLTTARNVLKNSEVLDDMNLDCPEC
jgi:DNA-binding IclR family transcriptional regulator